MTESEVKDAIRQSRNYQGEIENDDLPAALLIFSTSIQHTWVVSTSKRLYCLLDDVRKENVKVRWSLSHKKIIDGSNIVLEIQQHDKSRESGLVDIGPKHKHWLYSKRLFTDHTVVDGIKDLLSKKMLATTIAP